LNDEPVACQIDSVGADAYSRLVTAPDHTVAAAGRITGRVIHAGKEWMIARTVWAFSATFGNGRIEP